MNIKQHIPNFFTCCNLLCGCIGIIFAFNEHLEWSSYLIGIAVIFDFLDGFIARILKVPSDIGKQLDSLADMVTFGLLPGFILYQLIVIGFKDYFLLLDERSLRHIAISGVAFLVPVFSSLRLAKFNVDQRQANIFIGLPTPANAILVASFPLIIGFQYGLNVYYPTPENVKTFLIESFFFTRFDLWVVELLSNPYFYVWTSVGLSLLMVSPMPMFSLKFKGLKFSQNKIRYIFLAISILLVSTVYYTTLYFIAIPIIIILYLLLSIVYYLTKGTPT